VTSISAQAGLYLACRQSVPQLVERGLPRFTNLDHLEQAEERLASRLHVSRRASGVLDGDVDVPEVGLEPILVIEGVGPGRMVDGAERLAQSADDRARRACTAAAS